MKNILIVDDNLDLCYILSNILTEEGYSVKTLQCGRQVLGEIKKNCPDLVLLDIHLPDLDGLKVLEQLKKNDGKLIVIMLTAYGDIKGAVTAMKAGAFDYLTKPFENKELLVVLKRALQDRNLNMEMEYLKERTAENEMIGESTALRQIMNQVKVIAPTNMTVIIQGESGVGKELIANMIYKGSKRKGKPYIPIDCGAIPEALVESELFGHEKGAFTGAYTDKKGKFEHANEGTLFLDEITNLPEAAQAKLLRVLEERKVHPVGGLKTVDIDIRIIVATNNDISGAVKENKFRNDLFFRLNEFNILIPPLRERKEDIPVIANHFIKKANNEFCKEVKGISPEALKQMLDYRWPGNIRELKNVIKMAVLSAEEDYIIPENLPGSITKEQNICKLPLIDVDDEISYDSANDKFEKALITEALKRTGGNKAKAAVLLKIDRKTLYRKMSKLGECNFNDFRISGSLNPF